MGKQRSPWFGRSGFCWLTIFVVTGFAYRSNAEITWDGMVLAWKITFCWFVWCLIRLLASLFQLWRAPEKGFGFGWCGDVLAFAVYLFACYMHVFMLPRFLASKPSLTKYVESQLEKNRNISAHEFFNQRREDVVGLFTVRRLVVSEAKDGTPQMLAITIENTVTDGAGFAYVPSGAEPAQLAGFGPCYFEHLVGSWWVWRLNY